MKKMLLFCGIVALLFVLCGSAKADSWVSGPTASYVATGGGNGDTSVNAATLVISSTASQYQIEAIYTYWYYDGANLYNIRSNGVFGSWFAYPGATYSFPGGLVDTNVPNTNDWDYCTVEIIVNGKFGKQYHDTSDTFCTNATENSPLYWD